MIISFIYSFAFFNFYGCITNSQCDQFPDGLIAQLVEHYTGIVEVMGSNPVKHCTGIAEVMGSNHVQA